jgi:hypothetical protein
MSGGPASAAGTGLAYVLYPEPVRSVWARTHARGGRIRAAKAPAQAGSQVKRMLCPPWVQVTKRPSDWTSRFASQLKPSTEQVRL